MIPKIYTLLLLVVMAIALSSCEKKEASISTPRLTYEVVWQQSLDTIDGNPIAIFKTRNAGLCLLSKKSSTELSVTYHKLKDGAIEKVNHFEVLDLDLIDWEDIVVKEDWVKLGDNHGQFINLYTGKNYNRNATNYINDDSTYRYDYYLVSNGYVLEKEELRIESQRGTIVNFNRWDLIKNKNTFSGTIKQLEDPFSKSMIVGEYIGSDPFSHQLICVNKLYEEVTTAFEMNLMGLPSDRYGGRGYWLMENINFNTDVIGEQNAIIDQDKLYLFTKKTVQCINLDRKRIEWEKDINLPLSSKPILVDGVLYLKIDGETLYAIDAQTGGENWKTENVGGSCFNLAVKEDKICFISASMGPNYFIDMFLNIVDKNTGQILLKKQTPNLHIEDNYFSTSIVVDNEIIYCRDQNYLMALRIKSE